MPADNTSEKEQDRDLALFWKQQEEQRLATFKAFTVPISEMAAQYALCLWHAKFELVLAQQGLDIWQRFNFEVRNFTFTAQPTALGLKARPMFYDDLLAAVGEYQEIAMRQELLSLVRQGSHGSAIQQYEDFIKLVQESAATAFNEYVFAYIQAFAAEDVLPNAVDSLTQLKEFRINGQWRGNRLRRALEWAIRTEQVPDLNPAEVEKAWRYLLPVQVAQELDEREPGSGLTNLRRNAEKHIICHYGPGPSSGQPYTSLDMPLLSAEEEAFTVLDAMPSGQNVEEMALMRYETERYWNQLTEKEQQMVTLKANGFSDQKIAMQLGEPLSTVKKRLARLRKRMREIA